MILWFTIVQVIVALGCAIWSTVRGVTKRPPDDVSVLSIIAVELLLIAQLITALVAPGVGNPPTGDPLEYWMYLVTALLIPPIGVILAFVERSRWSSIVIAIAAFGIAVMVWRMHVIWTA